MAVVVDKTEKAELFEQKTQCMQKRCSAQNK